MIALIHIRRVHCTTGCDNDLVFGVTAGSPTLLDLLDKIKSLHDFSKDNVAPVKLRKSIRDAADNE